LAVKPTPEIKFYSTAMKLSQYFIPTLKETPIDATVSSHQLMVRAGMIRQTASGIYTWLPLGLKVLRKVEKIVKEEMDKVGALEVVMPTIQPAELWEESGRYDSYGKEMLRIKDRHNRNLLYGPTHEEVITDIFRKNVTSYKDLPKNFYQINWKFRDEIRPRFGVMRAREFLMKDAYSFDLNKEAAAKTYDEIYKTYFKIFRKMGLKAMAVKADTGAIGGELSHEFHILAETGESEIYYDKRFETEKLEISEMRDLYAMADEMHIVELCPIPQEQLASKRGIEVGHIFNTGTTYTKLMGASVMGSDGKSFYPNCGCYGIGISRIVAGAIEANHDDKGIIWPKELAPFQVSLINIRPGDEACDKACNEIYQTLTEQNIEVLLDDTKSSLGQKFSIADLIGSPTQIIVGPKSVADGKIEMKDRKTGEKKTVEISQILAAL
jgi:prolyl-tRNA synthetase